MIANDCPLLRAGLDSLRKISFSYAKSLTACYCNLLATLCWLHCLLSWSVKNLQLNLFSTILTTLKNWNFFIEHLKMNLVFKGIINHAITFKILWPLSKLNIISWLEHTRHSNWMTVWVLIERTKLFWWQLTFNKEWNKSIEGSAQFIIVRSLGHALEVYSIKETLKFIQKMAIYTVKQTSQVRLTGKITSNRVKRVGIFWREWMKVINVE